MEKQSTIMSQNPFPQSSLQSTMQVRSQFPDYYPPDSLFDTTKREIPEA